MEAAIAELLEDVGLNAAPVTTSLSGRSYPAVRVTSYKSGRIWHFALYHGAWVGVELQEDAAVGKLVVPVEGARPVDVAFAILRALAKRMVSGEPALTERRNGHRAALRERLSPSTA